jgi:hypothetical protein
VTDELQVFTEDTCPQGSPEWFQARAGVVTASCFKDVLAKGRGGGESLGRLKLLRTLAAEVITGKPVPSWGGNEHTERGHALEAEVRALYSAGTDDEVTQVGFLRRGRIGASPDSLVGEHGMLEIKTKLPHLQIELLETGALPSEHVAQVQGQLLVSGRQWVDFVSYWPGLPLFEIQVQRDTDYMSKLLTEIDQFTREMDALIGRYGSKAA